MDFSLPMYSMIILSTPRDQERQRVVRSQGDQENRDPQGVIILYLVTTSADPFNNTGGFTGNDIFRVRVRNM